MVPLMFLKCPQSSIFSTSTSKTSRNEISEINKVYKLNTKFANGHGGD